MPNVGTVSDNEMSAWRVYSPNGSINDREKGYWGGTGTIADGEFAVLAATPGTLADKEIVFFRTSSGLPVGLTVADYEYAASKVASPT